MEEATAIGSVKLMAGFKNLTESIDTASPAGRMMMKWLGAFAEFERAMLREYTCNGLHAARKERRIGGRRHKLELLNNLITKLVYYNIIITVNTKNITIITPVRNSQMSEPSSGIKLNLSWTWENKNPLWRQEAFPKNTVRYALLGDLCELATVASFVVLAACFLQRTSTPKLKWCCSFVVSVLSSIKFMQLRDQALKVPRSSNTDIKTLASNSQAATTGTSYRSSSSSNLSSSSSSSSSLLSALATSPSTMYHEYELEGGGKVRDATEGRVKAEFSKIDTPTGRRVYKILIKGHEVFAPNGTFPLAFCGSDSLKFKEKDGYIHIKELAKGQVSRVYVDAQKVKDLKEKEPLFFSFEKPCLLTEKQLEQRLNTYREKYLKTAKDIQIVAHNKHGVVVVGWDKAFDDPFYGSEQMPFVAISHGDDENWCFYMGREYGRYGVMKEADGRVKIMTFTSRSNTNGALEVHRYYDKDTHEEKIAINSEKAQRLSPEWMNVTT